MEKVEYMGLLDKLMGKEEDSKGQGAVDVSGLFDPGIRDVNDPRNLNESPPLLKAIREYQSPNNVDKSEIFTFDSEMRRTPDFYLPYYWAATYHFDKGNFEEARKILLDGIKNSNVKSVLCRRLGEYYLLKGDVDNALYWLFTTVMADTGKIDYHAYLYLAYIAEVYGLKKLTSWALRRSRGISYKIMMEAAEYSAKKKEKIKEIAQKNNSELIAGKLESFYRYAKPVLKEI
jgi:tetratricopeptide (TPR) repeat protein